MTIEQRTQLGILSNVTHELLGPLPGPRQRVIEARSIEPLSSQQIIELHAACTR